MTNTLNILEPFTKDYNRKVYATKIAKEINLPQKTVSRILNNLVERGILKFQRTGRNKEYYFDLTNPKAKNTLLKVEINKSIDFLVKHQKISLLIKDLLRAKIPVALFGSYAKKSEKKESDLDLLILTSESKVIQELVNKYPLKIHIQYSSFKEFKKLLRKNNALAKEILINHIIFNYFEKFIELFENE